MRRAFRFRLYPTKVQAVAMAEAVETHRHLYNRALAERKTAYETEKRTVRYGEQSAHIKEDRVENEHLARTNFSSCQATLRRLDKAFQAFFRRSRAGDKAGYPRFRGQGRYHTVEFPSYGDGCRLKDGRVYFQHIGTVKVKLHRPVEGTIKTVSFTESAGHWYVVFSCELPDTETPPSTNPAVGIDLGLKAFLTTSDGEQVAPPQFYRKAQAKLRRVQRHLSRCKRGSNRHKKAATQVAKLHSHVANQRRDWHHKTALALVQQYGVIAHESLNVKGIARTRLAKSTHDAGWTQFVGILGQKAECAAVTMIAVNPRNTTQACSSCGCLPAVPLTLSDRVYHCASCGHVADRDVNAATNIKRLGLNRQALTPAVVEVV